MQAKLDAAKPDILAYIHSGIDPKETPPRPFAINNLLRYGQTMLVSGEAGVGKTVFTTQLALAFITEKRWLNWQCRPRSDGECALFIDPENDEGEFLENLAKICHEYGISLSDIEGRFYHAHLADEPKELAQIADDVCSMKRPERFGFVVLDSIRCLMGELEENNAGDVDKVYTEVRRILAKTGGAAVIGAHVGKASAEYSAIHSPRGSTVWGDRAAVAATLTKIAPPKGEQSDVDGVMLTFGKVRSARNPGTLKLIRRHPFYIPDEDGVLANWRPMTAERRGGEKSGAIQTEKRDERAAGAVEALTAEIMRRKAEGEPAEIPQPEALKMLGNPKRETLKGWLEGSPLQIEYPKQNRAVITMKEEAQ